MEFTQKYLIALPKTGAMDSGLSRQQAINTCNGVGNWKIIVKILSTATSSTFQVDNGDEPGGVNKFLEKNKSRIDN
ncbi:hypothetical protein QCA50_009907 [Cerrena zonata]|uniref:Uncharacterized protein n=1 Tax=Cerrena zonata TaxID=2478898 RepID=A0AAW0GA81_9APHY